MVPAQDVSHVGEALEHKICLHVLHSRISMQGGSKIIYCRPSGEPDLRRLSPSRENTEGRKIYAIGNAVPDAEDGLPGEPKEDP